MHTFITFSAERVYPMYIARSTNKATNHMDPLTLMILIKLSKKVCEQKRTENDVSSTPLTHSKTMKT